VEAIELLEESLRIGYDREADVLYLSLGEPRKGMEYREVGNGIILRTDPATGKVIGLTVVDFVRNFSRVAQIARVPVTGEFIPVREPAYVSRQ
jgi:uncharacterized protein YuzE